MIAFTKTTARAAVQGYIAGRVTARTAHAALEYLLLPQAQRLGRQVADGSISAALGRARVRAGARRAVAS